MLIVTERISKLVLIVTALTALTNVPDLRAGSHTWSGATSGLWSVAGNWSAGGAPAAGESPLHLVFPQAATRFNATNDVTGLQVDTLTFNDSGYTLYGLAGKTLLLKAGTNIVCNDNNALDASLGLVLSNTNYINVTTNKQLTIQGVLSAAGSLAKIGLGQLLFSGPAANTYSGATLVLRGELILQRGAANNPKVAVPGPLFIGTVNGGHAAAGVTLNFSQQIAAPAALTMFNSGRLLLGNGSSQAVSSIQLNGGLISGAPDTLLTLFGNVTAETSTNGVEITCPVSLGGTNRTFEVSGFRSLTLSGSIRDGGNNAGLTKTGLGGISLLESNSYKGLTVIAAGLAEIYDAFALGTADAGTVVSNQAMLRLIGRFDVNGEALTLNGFGPYLSGCFYGDFDTNTWGGPVTLGSASRIQVLGPNGKMTFNGPISGPGALEKIGEGTLILSGTTANTYAGPTTVTLGKVELTKTNANAIASPLVIGDNVTPTNHAMVQLLRGNQIADGVEITVNSFGKLGFDSINSSSETIGTLVGTGPVDLGKAILTIGGNGDSSFAGVISGLGTAGLVKAGSGVLTLSGTNTFSGSTTVNLGKLVVNGVLPGPMQVNFLSVLGGSGVVGNLTASLAHLAPGNSVGKITTGSLVLNNGGSSLDLQINGPAAGIGYDQIVANGSVSLGNPALNISMGFPGSVGAHYVVIANDGVDSLSGTFNGLSEGAILAGGGAQFKISYKGGDGNDVELTQISIGQPQITGISRLQDGQIQIGGFGASGLSFIVEANNNLGTTNWVNIGSALAGPNGAFSFVDGDAPNHAARFYRFKAP